MFTSEFLHVLQVVCNVCHLRRDFLILLIFSWIFSDRIHIRIRISVRIRIRVFVHDFRRPQKVSVQKENLSPSTGEGKKRKIPGRWSIRSANRHGRARSPSVLEFDLGWILLLHHRLFTFALEASREEITLMSLSQKIN